MVNNRTVTITHPSPTIGIARAFCDLDAALFGTQHCIEEKVVQETGGGQGFDYVEVSRTYSLDA